MSSPPTPASNLLATLLTQQAHSVLVTGGDADSQAPFQDAEGLVAFLKLSSDLLSGTEYDTGQVVCDAVANFFATVRAPTFTGLVNGTIQPIGSDPIPTTQWDPSVTHVIEYLLQEAGCFASFVDSSSNYSETQVIAEFSLDSAKTIFDDGSVRGEVIDAFTTFFQGIGSTLRTAWTDKSENYAISIFAQCHREIIINNSGDTRYFPVIKYYYVSVDSSQQVFTTSCADVELLTFDFTYEVYTAALPVDVLDSGSQLYQSVMNFLDKAQTTVALNDDNYLTAIMDWPSPSTYPPRQ